jgi:hypothetical protein
MIAGYRVGRWNAIIRRPTTNAIVNTARVPAEEQRAENLVTVKDSEGQIDTYVNVEFLAFDDITLEIADIPVG